VIDWLLVDEEHTTGLLCRGASVGDWRSRARRTWYNTHLPDHRPSYSQPPVQERQICYTGLWLYLLLSTEMAVSFWLQR